MTITDLKEKHTHCLFATRDTIDEALKYACKVIASMPENERIYMYTAVYLVSNTVLAECEKLDLKEM